MLSMKCRQRSDKGITPGTAYPSDWNIYWFDFSTGWIVRRKDDMYVCNWSGWHWKELLVISNSPPPLNFCFFMKSAQSANDWTSDIPMEILLSFLNIHNPTTLLSIYHSQWLIIHETNGYSQFQQDQCKPAVLSTSQYPHDTFHSI